MRRKQLPHLRRSALPNDELHFKSRRRTVLAGIAVLLLVTAGCGYHTGGQAVRLPTDLHTLYVPTFINGTSIYRIEQTITEDVIRELHDRTHYRVVTTNADGAADATLNGTVTSAIIVPMTYDPTTETARQDVGHGWLGDA